MTASSPTLRHRWAYNPERHRDFIFRTDGQEVVLEDSGPARVVFGRQLHWQQVRLRLGSYWMVRLTNEGLLERLELIQFLLRDGGEPVAAYITFEAGDYGSFMDLLSDCQRYAHVPNELLARLEPPQRSRLH